MLKLNLKTEPFWIPLPGKIKVKVTPISTAIMSAAQANARIDFMAMEEAQGVVDADLRGGISEALLIKSMARLSIVEWEGVFLSDGVTIAPIERKTVDQLMDIWLVAQEFLKEYVTQLRLLEFEGNVLAPAANGTSAAEAHTAGNVD